MVTLTCILRVKSTMTFSFSSSTSRTRRRISSNSRMWDCWHAWIWKRHRDSIGGWIYHALRCVRVVAAGAGDRVRVDVFSPRPRQERPANLFASYHAFPSPLSKQQINSSWQQRPVHIGSCSLDNERATLRHLLQFSLLLLKNLLLQIIHTLHECITPRRPKSQRLTRAR